MTPDTNHINDSLDHLFRHYAGQMVSVLSRIFGVRHIDLIEDAVQDALVAAMRKWPHTEVPRNPRAWLTETAKNRVLDRLRRDSRTAGIDAGEFDPPSPAVIDGAVRFDGEFGEDQLRMIFACCHPSIAPDSQVALTLKIVGGFSVAEIAGAYLSNEGSIAKMLTRAKQKLRSGGVPLEIPAGEESGTRLDAVLKVLYLMFNEGYGASAGDEYIRRDLCFEAIRLVELVARHPSTALPKSHAAAALFFMQAARFPARADNAGELVLLGDQDRTLWDRKLIGRGMRHLQLSARGGEISPFHLEAEIAAIYSTAPDFASTDWERILECYSLLQDISFSPVAELNRVIVIGRLRGPEAGLVALESAAVRHDLGRYNLLHITGGHLLAELGRPGEAARSYAQALKLTHNNAVRRFVQRKLDELKVAA
jgi:RNA polymerase sigma factor (sigma-70 family)